MAAVALAAVAVGLLPAGTEAPVMPVGCDIGST